MLSESRRMRRKHRKIIKTVRRLCTLLLVVCCWLTASVIAQQQVPDAPSAVKKPQELPSAPQPAPAPPRTAPKPTPQPPASSEPLDQPNLPVPDNVRQATQQNQRDELATTIKVNVNFVSVPVTVKDEHGNLVYGLRQGDFAVYENGNPQRITFFSDQPFPMSAAVVIDTGLPSNVLDKVQRTLPALIGAFGQFDEVGIWVYGNTVKKVRDFTAATATDLDATVQQLKDLQGEGSGVPFAGGPFNSPPTINGQPVDPSQPPVNTQVVRTPSKVLNDAILAAAQDLASRNRANRRIIFVISDGREKGSATSYSDVLKVLLSHNLTVYAVGVGGAALPGYGTLQRIPIPKLGPANILPKFASATGGQTFNEFDTQAIETAYSQVTEQARNQYIVGYSTRATVATGYRDIEVKVHRPGCDVQPGPECVRVYARDGYYPLPPSRQ